MYVKGRKSPLFFTGMGSRDPWKNCYVHYCDLFDCIYCPPFIIGSPAVPTQYGVGWYLSKNRS